MAEIKGMRERHQEAAKQAAAGGTVPSIFASDPTFAELVRQMQTGEARETLGAS